MKITSLASTVIPFFFAIGCAHTDLNPAILEKSKGDGNSTEDTFQQPLHISKSVDLGSGRIFAQALPILSLPQNQSLQYLVSGGLLSTKADGPISNDIMLWTLNTNDEGPQLEQKAVGNLLLPRWNHRQSLIKSQGHEGIFICGGSKDGRCEVLNPQTYQNRFSGKLDHPRTNSVQVVLPNGNVLIAGGYNEGDPELGKILASIELYDPKTELIQRRKDFNLKVPRASFQTAQYKNKIFFLGGTDQNADQIEVLNTKKMLFEKAIWTLPFAIKDFSIFQDGSIVFLFGGTKADKSSSNLIFRLDLEKRKVEILNDRIAVAREDMSICRLYKKEAPKTEMLLLIGGETKPQGIHQSTVDVFIYDSKEKKLSREKSLAELPNPIFFRDDSIAISSDGVCFVAWGLSKTDEVHPNGFFLKLAH